MNREKMGKLLILTPIPFLMLLIVVEMVVTIFLGNSNSGTVALAAISAALAIIIFLICISAIVYLPIGVYLLKSKKKLIDGDEVVGSIIN